MRKLKVSIQKHYLILTLVVTLTLFGCAETPQESAIQTPQGTQTPFSSPTVTQTATLTKTSTITPTPTRPAFLDIDPESLSGVVVRFSHPWVGGIASALVEIVEEFSRENPYGIRVEVEAYGGEWALLESLQFDVDNGNVPGLIAATPYNLSTIRGDFYTINLSNYFDDPEWGFSPEDIEDLFPVFFEPFTIHEALIALPVAPQATVLYFNQTWAEELGFIGIPGDEGDFKDIACEATFYNWQDEDKADGSGGWLINLDPTVLTGWYFAFGGVLPTDETPTFNNEVGQAAFSYLWSVKNLGCSWFSRDPDPYFYFVDRFALVYAGRLDQIPIQTGWMEMAESADEWVVIGFPGPDGQKITVDGPGLSITANTSESQMAAWIFARYLLEPEVQAKLVHAGFSLPVRQSASEYLNDFIREYPQWGQAKELIDVAEPVPVYSNWGIARWVLQDAIFRLLQAETDQTLMRLEELDSNIIELETVSP